MSIEIKDVNDLNGLIDYLAQRLDWNINLDDFENIEDITYDFDAEDLGIKEEAFAKIISLRQLPPLVDGQKWGIFCVEFDSKRFEVSALRKILSGLIPKRRNSTEHAVWKQKDLLFICFWGRDNERTIGFAHFEDVDNGLPQIKMISCCPSVEDFTQISVFENRLKNLKWPSNYVDHNKWQSDWSSAFVTGYKQTIKDSATLTCQLANEARDIKNRILEIFKVETSNGYVHLLYDKFRNTLIHDMSETQFADMYAQTVVYGLFSARCMDKTQDDFSAAEAIDLIPNTNPFLKSLMKDCLGAQNKSKLSFDELEIGNIVDLLLHTKTDSIIEDFNRQTGGGREDPVIHFYEEFLNVYDKNQKINRGVFYTPQPIVRFIVNAVDHILKTEFGCEDGLASTDTKSIKYLRDSKRKVNGVRTKVEDTKEVPAIQILDPATGTGTFLRETILRIYDNFKSKYKHLNNDEIQKLWNEYVPKHLLPRINGFEIMMAPYAVAHMKLAMVLKDTGYDFKSNERLQVFLTNTLEEPGNSDDQLSLWDDPLAFESRSANVTKTNSAINVVIGNPPYSGVSANNGEWIKNLVNDYKYKHGEYFAEQKNWLNDDYVKFIRYAENIIENNEKGIVAFITNNGFLDNPTFRFMRYHLLESFDSIYIINLHGSTKKREVGQNQLQDENVFGIQQGVSIEIFCKTNSQQSALAKVFYHDIYGSKEFKFNKLLSNSLVMCGAQPLKIIEPFYPFVNIDDSVDLVSSYNNGFSPLDVYNIGSTGYISGKDRVLIGDSIAEIKDNIFNTFGVTVTEDNLFKKIVYRPFDNKYAFYAPRGSKYSKKIILPKCYRTRFDVMKHFEHNNFAILIGRQGLAVGDVEWNLAFYVNNIVDLNIFFRGGENVFPLYLYESDGSNVYCAANIKEEFIKLFYSKTGITINKYQNDDGDCNILNLSDYIYAHLYSHKYRKKFHDLLKQDLPKIPFPNDKMYFLEMANYGSKLRLLHTKDLLTSIPNNNLYFNDSINNKIDKIIYKDNKIFVNKDLFISNIVDEEWNFNLGGYQPLQKWLKDRKGLLLNEAQKNAYINIVLVIRETIFLMNKIDDFINIE